MSKIKQCSEAQHQVLRVGNAISNSKALLVLAGVFMLCSCGPSKEELEYREKALMQVISDSISAYAGPASDTVDGVSLRLVREANLKFKVDDVIASSENIEGLVKAEGGYVAMKHLSSNSELVSSVIFKADSLKEVKRYTTTNYITLKIPNRHLDTVLKKLAAMASFLDMSRLTTNNVNTQLYANMLAEKRYKNYHERLAQHENHTASKSQQKAQIEEALLQKQALCDQLAINSYALAADVNLSTVTIEIYQAPAVICESFALPPVIPPYEPGFSERLQDAVQKGCKVLPDFLLFVMQRWAQVVLLALFYIAGRKMFKVYYQRNVMVNTRLSKE